MISGHSSLGRDAEWDTADLLLLQRSGLFDGAWFLDRNPDLASGSIDPLIHFHRFGWRENRWPNAYFDPAWYLATNPDVRTRGTDPLLHYAEFGEAEGRQPIAHFDPTWYRETYNVPPGTLSLAHFLQHRLAGVVSPIPEFDSPYYVERYPDIAQAGMDPFEHYVLQGAQENRQPSAEFDPLYYRIRHLASLPDVNPLFHFRQNRHLPGFHAVRPADESDIPQEVQRTTRPGPYFEEVAPLPPQAARRAMLLAYYLPQFHPVPENDEWWGKGFTEWTNVARSLPRFAGHYQPRIPRDLGHYRLDGPATLKKQAALARSAGLHGFVFYFYWFDGRRLLDGPLEALLADPTIDLPFCLMWANENWTRRWDGSEHEVLLAQSYRTSDEAGLVATFLRHFADPRYIRLEGRPVLMVYRASLIPAGAVARWRRLFQAGGEDPLFIMAQSFDDRDPRKLGMDAAVEFPPHKLVGGLPLINGRLRPLDHAATAQVYAYEDMVANSDLTPQPYPLIRALLPGWDNDPRRQGAGMVVHGATPAAYQAWLDRLITTAIEQPVGGQAIVCINAWNEWGEGAYLEPDVHFGGAFLNATARAVVARGAAHRRTRVLLVGHDAFPAGAQMLLLNMGRSLRTLQGVEVGFLLLGDGKLLPQYRALAPTTVVELQDLARHAKALVAEGVRHAVINSAAAAAACQILAGAGITCTLLVHELPRLLRERNLVGALRTAVETAGHVVFGAAHVRDRVTELVALAPDRTAVLPQGLYRPIVAKDRQARRDQLRLPARGTLAMGLGYADLRKGFDLFLQAWRVAHARDPLIHMLWVGDIDPTVHAYLGAEMAAAEATGTFHHIPFAADGADWLVAADIFLLTSREDPLPTAVIEAMSVGLPTIAFEESGGVPDLLRDVGAGQSVPLGDVVAMVDQMRTVASRTRLPARRALARRALDAFGFDAYVNRILHVAHPGLLDVSVVVPNYNYAAYLPARLASVFDQTHPVAELVVLDDASGDDSHAVVQRMAAEADRRVQWIGADRNGGSVFRQWQRAAEVARSEWLWIAEADDAAEPDFLQALSEALRDEPEAVMAFTDSRAIDQDGQTLWPDHQAYYKQAGATILAADGTFDAEQVLRSCLAGQNLMLNASAVLWRRTALLAALNRCGPALDQFTMAGDWRLYAELLSAGGRVVYVNRPLNLHRRHDRSVTHRLAADRHLAEVEAMQAHMRTVLGRTRVLASMQRQALAAAKVALGRT